MTYEFEIKIDGIELDSSRLQVKGFSEDSQQKTLGYTIISLPSVTPAPTIGSRLRVVVATIETPVEPKFKLASPATE